MRTEQRWNATDGGNRIILEIKENMSQCHVHHKTYVEQSGIAQGSPAPTVTIYRSARSKPQFMTALTKLRQESGIYSAPDVTVTA
jgi:hypothetical protein